MVIMASLVLWMMFGEILGGFKAVFAVGCCENFGCGRKANFAVTSSRVDSCILYKGYCVSKCPIGYYSKNSSCSTCHSPCSSCNKHKCLSCKDSRYLSKHGICGSSCPADAALAKNSSSPRVRLVAGRSSLEGVVEVYHDGVWGTICANSWTDSNANVICKELNLGAVVESKIVHEDRFTRNDSYREAKIWLSAVKCEGTESSIFNCEHADWGENSCSHLEDVGIRCSGPDSNKRCLTTCGDGYFASKGKCFACPLDCKTCTSFNNCSSCNEMRYLEGDSCVANCKPGTFGDRKTLKCKQCPDECQTCNVTTKGPRCTSCASTFLRDGKCVDCCPDGVAYSKYLRLSGNYSSPYTGLLEVKYGGVWYFACDYFFDLRDARVFCRELGYDQPINYKFAKFRQGNRKVKSLRLYCNGNEKSFIDCPQRDWFTTWCSQYYIIELSCQPPSHGQHVLSNQCVTKCPAGTFHNQQNQCELCHRKCLTCAGGSENCLKCRKPLFFSGTTCQGTCPHGTYPNTTVQACLPCDKKCLTCDGRPDACLSCAPPFVRNGTYCGDKCPDGTYQKEYTCVEDCGLWHYAKDKMCHACPLNCIVCSSDSECKACKSGFVLTKEGKCNISCPRGQYSTPVAPESVGIDMQLRLSSVEGFKYKGRLEVKHQGVWGSVCDDGWHYRNALVVCQQLLLGPPIQNVYLRSQSFTELSISKIWLDDVSCQGNEDSLAQCHAHPWGIHNCHHHEDVHIECSPPGISRCEVECPPAFFTNGSSCLPCSSNCLNCTGSASNCSLCEKGYFRANDSSCVKKCPPGFYGSDKRHCEACHSSCWTCDGKLAKHCTSCKPPNLLRNDGVCAQSCPKGYYRKGVNPTTKLWGKVGPYEGVVMVARKGKKGFVCDYFLRIEKGNIVCKELEMGKAEKVYVKAMYSHYSIPLVLKNPECIGNERSILQCPTSEYYRYCSRRNVMAVKCSGPDLSSRCIKSCPTQSHFYITEKNSCEHCSQKCLRCERNATNCTACAKGLFLTWDNKCVSYCPEGTFLKDGRCKKCEDSCLACHQNRQNCIICADGKYVIEGGNCYDDCHGVGYRRVGSPYVRLGRYPERWSFSPNASQGVVEMFVDGNWFPVCGYNWNLQAAAVACRDLGYGDPIKKYSWWYYQRHYAYEQLKKINCSGEEKALKDCPRIGSCDGHYIAGVQCSRATAKKQCVKIKNPVDCGPGFYLNNGKTECLACSSDCVTCSGTASRCTSCNVTFVLHGSKCLEECPDGYYIHLKEKTCKRCSDKCKTCFDGFRNDRCSSCNEPYFLRDTSCVEKCYPHHALEDLVTNEVPETRVRLINGSNPREGFIQFKTDDGKWANLCYANRFMANLVCQELGFQNSRSTRYKGVDRYDNAIAASCDFYEGYMKDCSIYPRDWCYGQLFLVCSDKPLDKRVCRKENKVPCSKRTCTRGAPCVNGDDTVIPKGHSYCRNCPENYFGDGDNCTVISKFVPSVNDAFRERLIVHGRHGNYLGCYGSIGPDHVYSNRYSWYKDGEPLDLPDFNYHGYSLLSFEHFRDAGIYKCVLRSSAGSTSVTYNVTVAGPPIIERADNIDVLVGDSVILECNVFAHPPANITWTLNNITLNENSTRHGGARIIGNGSLWIPQSFAKDAGNYSCIAENSYGTTVQIVRLRVGEELRFEKKANTVVVSKGRKASFTCLPHSSDSSWLIKWRRNGVTLKTEGRYEVRDGSLTIHDVNSEHCGEYYCVAKDAKSIITSVGTLVIKGDPPCIHTPPQNLHLEDGMYARFYCAASGEPAPKIFWQNKSEANNVFEIEKVDISHVGVYRCSARSGENIKEAFAFLSVNDHHACPYIFKKPKSTSAAFGQKATFYCDGVAETSRTIVWYRSGHRLISSNKYKIEDDGTKLTINDVNRDDLGSYICIVSDKNNHASTSASLSSLNVGAMKDASSSSSNTAGIIIGVLSCILVILIVLFFLHRYRRYGSTPFDVINHVKRKTMSRFQSLNSHTVMHYDTSALVDDNDDDESFDPRDANPFERDQ